MVGFSGGGGGGGGGEAGIKCRVAFVGRFVVLLLASHVGHPAVFYGDVQSVTLLSGRCLRYCFSLLLRLQDTMEDLNGDFADVVSVLYLTSRSLDDAFDESISGEIFLFAATCEPRKPPPVG